MSAPSLAAVRELVHSVLPFVAPEDMHEHLSLRDLGADSVDRVEIISAVRSRFGVTAPLAAFADIPDLRGLVQFCEQGGRDREH
jgi:polyketide biosynthesis acyl carrier protein